MKFFSTRLFWHLVIVLAVVIPSGYYIVQELQIAGALGFPLDDSWIHMVFARNIAAGDFFAYNAHQPVAGSTSPLWTVVLAAGYFLTHSAILMPKILGILLNIALGFVVFRFALLVGLNDLCSVLTAALVVSATRLVWASVSGMEVSFYVLSSMCSVYWYVTIKSGASWKNYRAPVAAAIAASARPEMLLLPVFFLLHQLALRWRLKERRGKNPKQPSTDEITTLGWLELLKHVVIFAMCMVPFFALNLSLAGQLFPLTFTAKATDSVFALWDAGHIDIILTRFFEGIWVLNQNCFLWIWAQDNIALSMTGLILLFAVIISWGRKGVSTRVDSVLLLFGLIILFFEPTVSVVTGKLDFGQFGRYAAEMTPVMMLFGIFSIYRYVGREKVQNPQTGLIGFAAVGFAGILIFYESPGVFGSGHQWPSMNWMLPFLNERSASDIALYGVLLILVTIGGIYYTRKAPSFMNVLAFILAQFLCFAVVENLQCATEYGWDVKNINDTQVAIGEWLAQNAPAGAVYATNDVGAMAYYTPRDTMIDLMGLVKPEVAKMRAKLANPDLLCVWVLNTWHPDYLVCFTGWFPHLVRDGLRYNILEPVYSVDIQNNLTCGDPGEKTMTVYRVHPEKLSDFITSTHIIFPK